jgi:PleD family two-component response regulator
MTRRRLHRIDRAGGDIRYLEMTATNHLANEAVGGIVTTSRDVTARVSAASRLTLEAMHDDLTGLPNRALLLNRLGQTLERSERSEGLCAVLHIDLDHFKRVKDSKTLWAIWSVISC